MPDVEARDVTQILSLLADYGRTLDEGLWEEHLRLYADDCHLFVFGRDYAGRDVIDRFLRRAYRGHHLTGVPSIEFENDSAAVRSDYIFFRGDLRLYSAGSYEDRLVREDGRWRISSRKIYIRFRARDAAVADREISNAGEEQTG